MYYNTTQQTGEALKKYKETAKTQDERIINVFRRNPGKPLAASNIFSVFGALTPITSIRRALNTAEKQGLIEKTGQTQISPWGRPENLYRAIFKQKTLFE